MAKTYTHWITFDPAYLSKANREFREGSRFAVRRVYGIPGSFRVVFEVVSPDAYKDLDLNVDSLNSPLRRATKRPPGLGGGFTLKKFEGIYGKVHADEA